jgi:formate--tetrahydrofolate ligase
MTSIRALNDIAADLGILPEELEPYGRTKAKVSLGLLDRLKPNRGKLVLVTAISPTPFGEGKTVTTIGTGDGFRHLGRRSIVAIRQPSLGPVFGTKGGGAGGGKAQAHPSEELNMHFTGDAHAVTTAHNLLASVVEARHYHGLDPKFSPHGLSWKRVLDLTDRSLREIVVGLGGKANGPIRETGFDITAASEIMALLCRVRSYKDLKERLDKLVVGESAEGKPITCKDVEATGSLALLLKDAILPNLMQTKEGTPLFAHCGPFGNIATGHNSVLADSMALALGDVVVTEAGFGSDLGFEKFCHLVSPILGKAPDAVIVVATIRGLKAHSGKYKITVGKPIPRQLMEPSMEMLEIGAENLKAHLRIVSHLGLPAVVAVNRFPDDTDQELARLVELAKSFGAKDAVVSEAFAKGGVGNAPLASAVERVFEQGGGGKISPVYSAEQPLREKIEAVVKQIYGGASVSYSSKAESQLEKIQGWGYGNLPVCMAKTPYSLSADPNKKGGPTGFDFPVTAIELAAGAGFVKVLSGEIMTMPGLGKVPAAFSLGIDDQGNLTKPLS